MLFTAGFVAYTKPELLNIWVLIFGAFVCAVLGDNVGYATGHRFGRRLFQKEDSWLFHKKHLEKTQSFYEQHGKKNACFSAICADSADFCTDYCWHRCDALSHIYVLQLNGWFTLLGYFLGKSLPAEQVDKYLLPIIGLIIVVSLIPSIIHVLKENKASRP